MALFFYAASQSMEEFERVSMRRREEVYNGETPLANDQSHD
jgi:hypothetical protein